MSDVAAVHRDSNALEGTAKLFFEQVKNGQDEPELNNDYPYAYIVETEDGDTFIAFSTNLPEDRDPFTVEQYEFDRETVYHVEPLGGLSPLRDRGIVPYVNGVVDGTHEA